MKTLATSDADLIHLYHAGNESAFSELTERHLGAVYSFIARYVGDRGDAEDVVQDVFVKVWKNLNRFDVKRNFRTWLFTIAKNTALDWLKKKRPLSFSDLNEDREGVSFEETIAAEDKLAPEHFDEKLVKKTLTAGLAALPPEYRAVVLLRLDSQLTFREIAEMLRKPTNTIKSHYRRAIFLLRRFIDNPHQT